jgi:hypothetical protein
MPGKIVESGTAELTIGAIVDGSTLIRSGTTIAGSVINQIPTRYTPTSITKVSGGTPVGSVTDIQTLLDGNVYTLPEAVGTPGYELTIDFTDTVLVVPWAVAFRWQYDGSITHDVTFDIYDYNAVAFKQLQHIEVNTDGFWAGLLPLPAVMTNYITGGDTMQFRLIHNSAGNAAHNLYIDYIALVR